MKTSLLYILIALALAWASLCHAQESKADKILFLGNSITLHGPSAKIGWKGNWGMAATAADKDYVHLVVDAVAKARHQKPDFQVVNIADFERNYEGFDIEAKLKDALAFKADLVVLAIGENVPALKTDEAKTKFTASVARLIQRLKQNPHAAIFVRSCFWADAAKDAALKEACATTSSAFVDIATLGKDEANYARSERKIEHAGVARHPGDQGMHKIADAISAAIETLFTTR